MFPPGDEKWCKSCPFKPDKDGNFQHPKLATTVIKQTFLQGQHTCHSTDYGLIDLPKHRCHGSFKYFKEIYEGMGIGWMIQEEPMSMDELAKKLQKQLDKE